MGTVVTVYVLTVAIAVLTLSHGAKHRYEEGMAAETKLGYSTLGQRLKNLAKSPNKFFQSTRKDRIKGHTNQKVNIFPRSVDENILIRPQQRQNIGFDFDQNLYHGIYRPDSYRNVLPQSLTDQHIISRPHESVFPNLNTVEFNQGQSSITKPYKPVITIYENKPNTGSSSYTRPVGLKPPYNVQTAMQPPHFILLGDGIHYNRPNIDLAHHQFQNDNRLLEKPSNNLRPEFIILTKNVFIGPRKGSPGGTNPDQTVETLNGIRYDHGRDYHLTPDHATIEVNKEVSLNVPGTGSVSKPPYQSLSTNNIVHSVKQEVSTSVLAANKGNGAIDTTNPTSLQLEVKPSTDNNGLEFHPLLSPYGQWQK